MEVLRKHHISFKNAFAGLVWSFTTQPNFKIHIFFSILALLLCYILEVSKIETAIIILTIVFGLGVEMVNTSIEAMTDLITTNYHKDAKIAKDVAAGMMLLIAVGAIIIGLFIFLPKILARF